MLKQEKKSKSLEEARYKPTTLSQAKTDDVVRKCFFDTQEIYDSRSGQWDANPIQASTSSWLQLLGICFESFLPKDSQEKSSQVSPSDWHAWTLIVQTPEMNPKDIPAHGRINPIHAEKGQAPQLEQAQGDTTWAIFNFFLKAPKWL